MNKIFCKECKHISCQEFCVHPKNKRDSWYDKNFQFILSPKDRNHNNDCELFERKEGE